MSLGNGPRSSGLISAFLTFIFHLLQGPKSREAAAPLFSVLFQYLFGCVSKPMGSQFGVGTTHFRTYFSWDWDVHWGYDLDFDPWPFKSRGGVRLEKVPGWNMGGCSNNMMPPSNNDMHLPRTSHAHPKKNIRTS